MDIEQYQEDRAKYLVHFQEYYKLSPQEARVWFLTEHRWTKKEIAGYERISTQLVRTVQHRAAQKIEQKEREEIDSYE